MGIFSFIKNAGAKVFGVGKTTEEEAAEKSIKLVDAVNRLELPVENLAIAIEEDKATISGEAADLATKEKVILVVGNTNGIGSVEDNMSVAPVEVVAEEVEVVEEIMAQFHTVGSGDTLGKIAKEFYGDPMKYTVIFEANKPMLSHPDKIYPGQVLRVPALVD
ncbi:peptidoglycan-binding protein LysM [Tenacibaculum finnmarkense genomovar finnmarkense]|uniref:Potassium binding protein Kbp n=1 Tax=Tenacibaculum finnmarkense genomovar finnmarkense TaxID=1458503 RepID=A0AAP1RE47_9FLAO|nr:peptidoglycan-binding protein LysM [Tenacibaculum finnmarkense]MBE7652058.1 peptidoglycan-binding protein LysM [Tenacibaculum finnmarkense genomovar finnmarkense]MBE7658979.1 peptidoglycan-binding protein LysM [Tenacibaculum finnmarkense genomovar finnmarkense]MBE7691797.1 peptidoglycan-binding protein LysM [Tenacibaculum finnmarkense genomovar finnmarkense]MBE7694227.1 peptidoglycan-binding protein LysM [Tenacibaculum finnmarkense genomovar finnmarkense]MCD8401694.1 peptidoglycan-binding p